MKIDWASHLPAAILTVLSALFTYWLSNTALKRERDSLKKERDDLKIKCEIQEHEIESLRTELKKKEPVTILNGRLYHSNGMSTSLPPTP